MLCKVCSAAAKAHSSPLAVILRCQRHLENASTQQKVLLPSCCILREGCGWRETALQVITAVLAHFTRGMPPLTVRADAKVPGKYWSKGGTVKRKYKGKKLTLTFPESNEGQMLVRKGELVSGILDKAVFGKFGLVHAVQVHEHPSFPRLPQTFTHLNALV